MAEHRGTLTRAAGRARRDGARVLRALARRVEPGAKASTVRSIEAPAPAAMDGASEATGTRVELDTAPARPLPDGWDEAEIRAVMASFEVDGSGPGELTPYVDDALWRFLHTWGLVRDERGRALELGGNPYFITWLLRDFTDLDVTVANYFGGPKGVAYQHVRYRARGAEHDVTVGYDSFNLEEDAFPYPDGSFRVVLFCEIIEHLLMDPLHALGEINRVLEPGGTIVLTTPNVARVGNVLALLDGANIYDPYSGFGPYGRHNREFTRAELRQLLAFAGFHPQRCFTADAHPADVRGVPGYDVVAPTLAAARADELGQYHFVTATKAGAPREGLPTAFYRSWPPDRLVEF